MDYRFAAARLLRLGGGGVAPPAFCFAFCLGELLRFASLRGVSAGGGGMDSVAASAELVAELVAEQVVELAVAAFLTSSPSSTVERRRRDARGSASGDSTSSTDEVLPPRSLGDWSSPLVSSLPVLKKTGDGGAMRLGPTMPRKCAAQL